MKTFQMLSSSLIGFLFFCITVFAAGPTAPSTAMQAQPRKLPADLVVQYVEYFNCPCNISNPRLNTEYVTDGIWVKVGNASMINSVTAKVTAVYFDITTQRSAIVIKTVTLNANQWTKVEMVSGSLLIGKYQGVSAMIQHVNTAFIDPTPSNNRVVQKTCGPMVE